MDNNLDQAADTNNKSSSDDDDLYLFESRRDPELARQILRIKHNALDATSLELTGGGLNKVVPRR